MLKPAAAMQLTEQDAWQQRPGHFATGVRKIYARRDGRLRGETAPQLGKPLAPREIEALQCLREGLTYARTDVRMGLGHGSSKTYVRNAMAKFGMTPAQWREQGMPGEVTKCC